MSTPENQTQTTQATPAAETPATPAPAASEPAAARAASRPAASRARAPRRSTTKRSTTKAAAAKPASKRSAATASRKPATKPQPASRAKTIKETVMQTPNEIKAQSQKLYDEGVQQAETLRVKGLEFGRQFAELSLDATEKAVHSGADLYVKAVEQLPLPYVKEIAKVQADLTVKATDLFVRQGRQLVSKP
jgi:hypothetical protein